MPRPTNVVLYTRTGCHLCEVAQRILSRYNVKARFVDIDEDPELVKLYNTCVPVVTIDGKVRFRGTINERLLRRLLHDHG